METNLTNISLPKNITDESVGVLRIVQRPQEGQIAYLNAAACRALSAWLRELLRQ